MTKTTPVEGRHDTFKSIRHDYHYFFIWTDGRWRMGIVIDGQDRFLWMKVGKPYEELLFFGMERGFDPEDYDDCPAIGIRRPIHNSAEIKDAV